jgi:hypothetical protein
MAPRPLLIAPSFLAAEIRKVEDAGPEGNRERARST